MADNISNFSDFTPTLNLRKYLKINLISSTSNKREYRVLADKIKEKVSSWEGKNLSMGGRVTLTSSILFAIPIYDILVARIPKSIYRSIKRLQRDFI